MKKSLILVGMIMLIAVFLHMTTEEQPVQLELYRQGEEGKAVLMGRIEDERVAEYQAFYRGCMAEGEPEGEPETLRYPDVAVYLIDGSSVIHHSSFWFWENGEGMMASVEAKHRTKPLTAEKVEEIRTILDTDLEDQ
ncbi:hypothetical protein [Anoxynatronum buryatiense]|uniref:Uncharacterized protein n=1 Tax=Anoxynatronum buryatiense TaxID=489973 RepID=A0AA46AJF8_9CLOT|nr:hypothetical protein [Anoxynatronum buryatiense]SMP61819.1 hypothetical protein SAMN06296020_109101 [Anoxynatronum buryatiense]